MTVCEHHLLPFSGVAHVAYLPGERWAGAVLAVERTCMTLPGVRARGSVTVTTALAGPLRSDPRQRAEFLALTGAPT